MRTKGYLLTAALLLAAAVSGFARKETLHIVSTGDVHGCYFDVSSDGGQRKHSLMSVKYYVDSLRAEVGKDNVLLIDAGDILQGDNIAYYYNFVDTVTPHIYPRVAKYMGYDVVTLGNHDIETGHPVYDRVAAQLAGFGIPLLSGNVLNARDSSLYFPAYTVVRKAGIKIAVLGFNNPNISAWLPQHLWDGLLFENLLECVQKRVDEVIAAERPQMVVVAVHSGSGTGDGSVLENQALDLLYSLHGVDVLIGAHDHRPLVARKGETVYVNSGARASAVGHVEVSMERKSKSFIGMEFRPEVALLDKNRVDKDMRCRFASDIEAVSRYTARPVGSLKMPLLSRESFRGMCDYINFLHYVQIESSGADISFAAPLSFNGTIPEGTVRVRDLFSIYPYENQLYVMSMTGSEILSYLEYSYSQWIETESEHLLRIRPGRDERTGSDSWSFVGRTYNFDSAGGLNYTVDINAPEGQRIRIESLADGRTFSEHETYTVAMTSYRASGGGDLLLKGALIPDEELDTRVIGQLPEIRELIRQFFEKRGVIDSHDISDPSIIGGWRFVPEDKASGMLDADMKLIF